MDILRLEGSDDTPKIVLDKAGNVFEITGRSLPEDTVGFFEPVVKWITAYAKEANPSTDFTSISWN